MSIVNNVEPEPYNMRSHCKLLHNIVEVEDCVGKICAIWSLGLDASGFGCK